MLSSAKGQPQPFKRSLDRTAADQALEQFAEPRRIDRVPGQYVRQENGEGSSAASALASVGAPDPLAAMDPPVPAAIGFIAVELTVAIQRFGGSTKRAAELLEQKQILPQFLQTTEETTERFSHPPCCGNSAAVSSDF